MTRMNQIVEMPVAHHLEEADRLAKEMGRLNDFSERGYPGAQAGKLGELVAYEYMGMCGLDYEVVDLMQYDAKLYSEGKAYTLDIKTKERTVPLQEHYEFSVYSYLEGFQNPDYYFFVSLLSTNSKSEDINRFTKAYVAGSISSHEFGQNCRYLPKGYYDPSNGWVVKRDTRNIYVSQLYPPKLAT